ncbi:GAF domain-containing protein [Pygmaiobacter massiliensis]|uniref:GAF domain-containing protein n=1 Tax=Pygmaiobacter massiliensis TaxID=1917873 RepID=UPI0035E3EC4B
MELTWNEFGANKQEGYELLFEMAKALAEGEPHPLANLANLAALLGEALPEINWAGFYLMHQGELLLGPFWGKPACLHIALGRGVCGTAAATGKVQRVEDVHAFPGHIACDAASASEIVLPLYAAGKLVGVLDIDSPRKGRFTAEDEEGLTRLAAWLGESSDWSLCGYTL